MSFHDILPYFLSSKPCLVDGSSSKQENFEQFARLFLNFFMRLLLHPSFVLAFRTLEVEPNHLLNGTGTLCLFLSKQHQEPQSALFFTHLP